jgi:uncharacterized membrane protein (UPF0127 family)
MRMRMRCGRWAGMLAVAGLSMLMMGGCFGNDGGADSGRPSAAARTFPLEQLQTAAIRIGTHSFRVWLALTPAQQAEGLMFVPEGEIADDQGMLFVFRDEQLRGFWMRNTITPLDIAYARSNGRIVKIWQMPALTLQNFPSLEPAMFALEVKQGTFERLGIQEGAALEIPAEVFQKAGAAFRGAGE